MRNKNHIDRDVDRIMADLENIPREIPPPYLAGRIMEGLERLERRPPSRPFFGWLKPALIGIMLVLNIFLCYLAITSSRKSLEERNTALDRLAAEYEMIAASDPFSNR